MTRNNLVSSIHLHLLYFLLGIITDFTETSELAWLKRFSIYQIQWIVAIINFAWSPVRWKIATLSDKLSSRCNPYTQCGLGLLLPAILWIVLSDQVEVGNKWAMLFCLIIAEFGPSINHTINDGIRSRYYHQTKQNLVSSTEIVKLIGSFSANLTAAYVFQNYGIPTVFAIQSGLVATTIVVCFLGRFCCGIKQQQQYEGLSNEEDDIWSIEEPPATAAAGAGATPKVTPPPPVLSKSFMLFMTFLASLPTGGSCLIYYLYGPVQLSMSSVNIIDAIGAIVMICTTYITGKINFLNKRVICWIAAFGLTMIQFLCLVLVTRLHVPYLSDFMFLLGINILAIFIGGFLSLSYMSSAAMSTNTGSEAGDYAYFTVIPSIGKMIKIGLDTGLTKVYKVDHDNFEGLPVILTITTGACTLALFAALFVRR
jgi:hypothetical protein